MKTKEIQKFRESYTKYEKECVFEGYALAVHFDEKEMVKKYGGRWDADKQIWWIPKKHLLTDAGVGSHRINGTLIRDVLNDHKMIVGPYGKFISIHWNASLSNKSHEEFWLRNHELSYLVAWYESQDAVEFVGPSSDTEEVSRHFQRQWFTIKDAKKRWDELITEGYIRVENS